MVAQVKCVSGCVAKYHVVPDVPHGPIQSAVLQTDLFEALVALDLVELPLALA